MNMKNKLFAAFVVIMLLCHVSCEEGNWGIEDPGVQLKQYTIYSRVRDLIQQVRNGDVEAYKSLAFCYRDGNGVKQSYLNAMFMYYIYIKKRDHEFDDFAGLFDETNPYRLLVEILNSPDFDDNVQSNLVKLKEMIPVEAKCIEAMKTLFVDENTDNVLDILEAAESEGSELAGILQAFYLMEIKKDMVAYQQRLVRLANKHPFLNAKIAELFEMQYEKDNDFSNIHKAIEYYYKADSYGMLSPKNANKLWSAYSYFSQKDMLEYDEDEIERLKKIIKTKKKK